MKQLLVTLIGNKAIHKLKLPQVVTGNYWLTDKSSENEKKLINIEGKNGNWQIISNNYVQVINPK